MTLITTEQEIALRALYNTACGIISEDKECEGVIASMKFLKEDFFEKYFNQIINHDTSRNPSLSEGTKGEL